MTGQDLLDTMEVLNQELQLQTSEADVVRGLIALNRAQDYFESRAAKEGKIQGDTTTTITSTVNVETTAWPAGYLRINKIQHLDPASGLPDWDLDNLAETGSHAGNVIWPGNLFTSTTPGIPDAYYTNGRLIYWAPIPSGTHSFRVYGFAHAADITASGTFLYDDELCLPFASFASKLLKIGVDDSAMAVDALGDQCFKEAIAGMAMVNRTGGTPFIYTRFHTT